MGVLGGVVLAIDSIHIESAKTDENGRKPIQIIRLNENSQTFHTYIVASVEFLSIEIRVVRARPTCGSQCHGQTALS